jgi:hypothetical protein
MAELSVSRKKPNCFRNNLIVRSHKSTTTKSTNRDKTFANNKLLIEQVKKNNSHLSSNSVYQRYSITIILVIEYQFGNRKLLLTYCNQTKITIVRNKFTKCQGQETVFMRRHIFI